jgi:hypothetical protein
VSAAAALKDPLVAPSVAWDALKRLLGPTVAAWEFDTIRIELDRRGIPTTDSLMAKLFGAMTVAITDTWTYDHDVLYSFAVACNGVPANGETTAHPTPEQLCWAVKEIQALTGAKLDDDEGFDPDAIDPAIAAVLHDEGYLIAPLELSFVQDALDDLNRYGDLKEIKAAVTKLWASIKDLPTPMLRKHLEGLDEGAVQVQIHRIGDCKLYVAEHELLRAKQHAALDE